MYITKILLDVRMPMVRRELAGLNYLKDTLAAVAGSTNFRYRLENVPLDKTGFKQPLVLVSEKKPDISSAGKPEGFFSDIATFEYRIPVRQGMIYKFFLRANPSTKILFFNSEIKGRNLQVKWIESEAVSNGFQVIDCDVKDEGYILCPEKKVKLLTALFEGSLKITDENKFKKMLITGIGQGRDYGLGLLSIESYGCRNRNIAEEMKEHAENITTQNC